MTARSGAGISATRRWWPSCCAPPAAGLIAQEAAVTPLMTKELADMPGKEALMITVEYPPGG
jgi:hypothetical protein